MRIFRSSQKVTIEISVQGYNVPFSYTMDSEFSATLLSNATRETFYQIIQNVRREAYNDGWKDAKSKKNPKRTEFSGYVN
jgi:hypothetical protein